MSALPLNNSVMSEVNPPAGGTAAPQHDITRSMPFSNDAEKGVLSCFLHNPTELVPDARHSLAVEAFYHPANRLLFQVILEMDENLKPIEYIALSQRLQDSGQMDKIGGQGCLAELLDFVPTPTHYGYYKGIMRRMHARRMVIGKCTELIAKAYDCSEEENWQDLCIEAQGELFQLTQEHGQARRFEPAAKYMDGVETFINEAIKNRGHVTHGIATGFTDLDRLLMGLRGGQLIIIAARPKMGKSSLADNLSECIAMANGHYHEFNQAPLGVGQVTLEMSAEEKLIRMTMGGAGVSMGRVRDGFVSAFDKKRINEQLGKLRAAPIYILDTGDLTIQELRGLARHAVAQHKIKVLIVDYLQLLKSNTKMAKGSRYVEVGEVSRGLKALAKELNIPIIALAQLGRKPEERKDGRPVASDLRESGDIEQDADMIGLIHRISEYVDCPDDEDPDAFRKKATLIVAMHRNGPVGDIPLKWEGPLVRFSSTTEYLNSNNQDQHQGAAKKEKGGE